MTITDFPETDSPDTDVPGTDYSAPTRTDSAGALPAEPAQRMDLPCQSGDADLWFAEEPAALETAKSLCRGCPLQAACLDEALARAEPWGVWGGQIFDRGVVIARKRPRGRPRKDAN
jgi:WhiB family redox-sensing transcriptional regulator